MEVNRFIKDGEVIKKQYPIKYKDTLLQMIVDTFQFTYNDVTYVMCECSDKDHYIEVTYKSICKSTGIPDIDLLEKIRQQYIEDKKIKEEINI